MQSDQWTNKIFFGNATDEMDGRKIPRRTGEVFSYLVIEVRRDGLPVVMPKGM